VSLEHPYRNRARDRQKNNFFIAKDLFILNAQVTHLLHKNFYLSI
jgi:hypothetical protein